MPMDHRLYLDDIIEAVARIRQYTAGMDEGTFGADTKTQDAVVRNLEVIGEAAARLPDEIRQAAPNIEWHKIRALHNLLIHDYFGIHLPIVWNIVQTKLDTLDDACRNLLLK